ncbi:MAG TPA: PfkB family carbohydrate kinase [Levilinea sp.]|nr:PfkB family carbohydrate kinase [Levilinea sp.]
MLITFSIILDDIVFPDGTTRMAVLGGGGPQTAFGMRLWAGSVGIVAGVGDDFPVEAQTWFEQSGIDMQGVRRAAGMPTPRAWQVLEQDGRRTQVWRVPGDVIGKHLRKRIEDIPEAYRAAAGFHIGLHPLQPDLDFIHGLGALGGVISLEPFKPAEHLPQPQALAGLLAAAHIFTPNTEEAVSLVGRGEPLELVRRLIHAGAKVVALRMGAAGSLVAQAGAPKAVHIPAVPLPVVDPVGAGNAYCGGFLAGWVETGDIRRAGLYGSVAASFLVEQVGAPVCSSAIRQSARRRLKGIAGRVVDAGSLS